MAFKRLVLAAFFSALTFSLLLAATGNAETVIKVGGNGTGLEVIKVLVPSFEKEHPGIKVQVTKSLGSSGGIKALNGGALDLALSSRQLKPVEAKEGAEEVFQASTPFIIMANPSVTKSSISTKELEAIYDGSQTKWPDGSQIRLVLRPTGDTDTRTMEGISPKMKQALAALATRPGMLTALTDEDSDRYISQLPGALGGSSLAQVDTGKLSCRILALNGIKPSAEALANGSYPLGKDLIMVVNHARTSAATRAFVDFVRSARGTALLRKLSVVAENKGH